MEITNDDLTSHPIGEKPVFDSEEKQLLNKYIDQFIELNREERELRDNYDENNSQELKEFYSKKNRIALNFLRAVNNGEISTETLGIWYLDNSRDTNYYDKILIDIKHEYDQWKRNSIDDCFVILPPVIAKMEDGIEQLYKFMDSHIKKTIYDIEEEEFHFGGPFTWEDLEEIYSSKQLEEAMREIEEQINKFENLENTDYYRENAKRRLDQARERIEKIIDDDMKKYSRNYI